MTGIPVDAVLERMHREMPAVLPHYETRWQRYLMSWQPVMDDESGGLRGRLRSLRGELREELGIPSAREQPAWDRRAVVSCKWFLYEEGYIDKEAGRFRAHEFVADARSDFGAMDEVILWQGYPRLGLDSPEKSTLGVKAPSTKIG